MALTFKKLHPLYGVEIGGVDVTRPVDARTFGQIRAAFEEHSVVLFRDQPMDDTKQIAFSELFGPLEISGSANPGVGTPFARQSNLDIKSGETIPVDDWRMIYQKANYLWHSDSSFKRVPSLCSLLSGRICPPSGGNTELTCMRAGYRVLPDSLKNKIETLVAEHALSHSRDRVEPGILSAAQKAELPAVRQGMVRVNPINFRKALYVGAHAGAIEGWNQDDGRGLIDELIERATIEDHRISHAWREGDIIVWDNRAVVHRATAYDTVKHKRLMQRTTVGGNESTLPR